MLGRAERFGVAISSTVSEFEEREERGESGGESPILYGVVDINNTVKTKITNPTSQASD